MCSQESISGGSADRVCYSSYIRGVGANLPERIVKNDYFASYLDTNDEWIVERTGIKERRWVEPGVSASNLAAPACQRAIKSAGLAASDIDGIVVATVTPDYAFPSTGCVLQAKLGISGFALDVNAVCCGFLYALGVAEGLVATGKGKNVLVVGVDIYSANLLDHNDRGTCILFGDGAGAVVLSRASELADTDPSVERISANIVTGNKRTSRGLYSVILGADGHYVDILKVPSGTACVPTPQTLAEGKHFLQMEGREVFKLAVRRLAEINRESLAQAGLEVDDVDFFATHQANMRILSAVAKQLSVSAEKLLINVDRVGNTSAASVPILLAEAVENGVLGQGDLVVLSAFGGGVTWGAAVVRW